MGLLYLVNGYLIIDSPVSGTLAITLLLAAMLIFLGTLRIIAALVLRFHHWGWPLLNGIISLLLGVMIYKQWPASGLWVIGLFIGIELIFNGWSWVMLAIGLHAASQDCCLSDRGLPKPVGCVELKARRTTSGQLVRLAVLDGSLRNATIGIYGQSGGKPIGQFPWVRSRIAIAPGVCDIFASWLPPLAGQRGVPG